MIACLGMSETVSAQHYEYNHIAMFGPNQQLLEVQYSVIAIEVTDNIVAVSLNEESTQFFVIEDSKLYDSNGSMMHKTRNNELIVYILVSVNGIIVAPETASGIYFLFYNAEVTEEEKAKERANDLST